MYPTKHYKGSHARSGKSIALLVSLLLILCAAVGGTIAFLMDKTAPLDNEFSPSQITTKVEESLEDGTKSNVKIRNTGDTKAWIRAAVVVTWQDKDGNVYGKAPVGDQDYDITWGTGWETGKDGFYYWTKPVVPHDDALHEDGVCCTGNLIESCTSKDTAPADYFLTVEIIASGIQSKPAQVFHTEWASSGLTVKDKDDSGNVLDPVEWTLVKEVQQ